jgi:hypothetical protein
LRDEESGGDAVKLKLTFNNVGTAALGCPAERSYGVEVASVVTELDT